MFDGDNYDEAWHAEAEKRGLANLRTTPDALPWLVEEQTIATFERYKVLSERELESRFEVMVEQYTTRVNIEAETAASIARTMLLPAAIRHLADLKAAGHEALVAETEGLVGEFYDRDPRPQEGQRGAPGQEGLELARYMRDTVMTAMDAARDVADRLERIVADDLWPLPKYSEMLFIKYERATPPCALGVAPLRRGHTCSAAFELRARPRRRMASHDELAGDSPATPAAFPFVRGRAVAKRPEAGVVHAVLAVAHHHPGEAQRGRVLNGVHAGHRSRSSLNAFVCQ